METICLKCLEKDPARRYATVHALLEDLRRFESGEPISARRPSPLANGMRFAARQWKLIATTMVVAGLSFMLLDKSVQELRTWGKEREAAGGDAGAVDVYRRAYEKASGAERDLARDDLIRCARATDDPKVAVLAAMTVLPDDPTVTFGKHDYLIAQSILANLRAKYPDRGVGDVPIEEHVTLELAEKRLKQLLKAEATTPAGRREAEEALSAVTHALTARNIKPESSVSEKPLPLPTGSQAELKQLAEDPQQTSWSRGFVWAASTTPMRIGGRPELRQGLR